MDLSAKDIWLLVAGGGVGFIASLAAGLFAGPVATVMSNFWVIRTLGWIVNLLRLSDFRGDWQQTWEVTSEHYDPQNTSDLRLYKFWDRVAGEFDVTSKEDPKTKKKVTTHFRLFATYQDDRLTGWWQDTTRHGYHGAFQVCRSPTHGPFVGVWCGYSATAKAVKSGQWTLLKKS